MNKVKLNCGYTTLELIISLGLMAPIALGIVQLGSSLAKSLYTLNLQYESARAISRSFTIIEDNFKKVDSYPIHISPRVHSAGNITYTDGTSNSVNTGSRAASIESDALTNISISSNSIYRVIAFQNINGSLDYTACLPFSSNVHDTKAKTFIGLSLDNKFELVGQSRRIIGRVDCRKFTLRQTKSMILPGTGQNDTQLVKILLPVNSYSTLYLDRSGILRYLGHRGEINTENQPLVEKLKKLNFSLDKSQGYYQLNTKITTSFGKIQKSSVVSNLNRIDSFSLFSIIR